MKREIAIIQKTYQLMKELLNIINLKNYLKGGVLQNYKHALYDQALEII